MYILPIPIPVSYPSHEETAVQPHHEGYVAKNPFHHVRIFDVILDNPMSSTFLREQKTTYSWHEPLRRAAEIDDLDRRIR